MPGFITHYLGGQSALKHTDPKICDYIAPMSPLFNLGTQGPDIFFYYVPGFITKRIRNVGTQMHDSDLGLFFVHMADIIKESHSPSQRKIVFAYVAGFLAHYAVDVHTHPYVYSQTHEPPNPKIKEATRHRHFETSVDVQMLYRLYGRQPADYKLWQLISPEKLHMRAAAAAVSASIRQVYDRDINPWDVYRAMEQMAYFTKCLQSKHGWRKRMLQWAEGKTVGSHIISALIHMQEITDGRDYLNIKKAPWSPPWAPEEARTESFVELFEAAVQDAARMIQALFAYMHNELPKNQLALIIRNCSLKTGICDPLPESNWLASQNVGGRKPQGPEPISTPGETQ